MQKNPQALVLQLKSGNTEDQHLIFNHQGNKRDYCIASIETRATFDILLERLQSNENYCLLRLLILSLKAM